MLLVADPSSVIMAVATRSCYYQYTDSLLPIFCSLLNDIKKKDFQSLAAKLGMTVNRCLVYYYRYFKSSPDYKEFKRLIVGNTDSDNDSQSSDHQKCCYCGNYGHLIFCDGCNRAYHPSCVKPPLLLVS